MDCLFVAGMCYAWFCPSKSNEQNEIPKTHDKQDESLPVSSSLPQTTIVSVSRTDEISY